MRLTQTAIVIATGLALLAIVSPCGAVIVATPTGPVKAAHSDRIVIGKVAKMLKEPVEAVSAVGAKVNIPFTIYEIEVSEAIKGDAKEKILRIGQPASKAGAVPAVKVTVGQEGLFFLQKHPAGDFHTLPMAGAFVSNKNKGAFTLELDEVRKTLTVLAAPLVALKAAEPARRLEATYLLLTVYHTVPPKTDYKLDPIPAAESKLLLKTLIDSDWDYNKYKGANFKQNPAKLFELLGVGAKDGFQKPIQGILSPEYASAAKKWLAKNWETYSLNKVVITGTK
jgi:hypothetical protein